MAASDISTAKAYLRRKFTTTPATATVAAVYNVPALKALADTVAASAFDAVAITGQTFEGGSHQGQLVFPRLDYLRALEELIAELDETVPRDVDVARVSFQGNC